MRGAVWHRHRGWVAGTRSGNRSHAPVPVAATDTSFLAGPGLPRAAEVLESHKVLLWAPAVGSCVTTGMPPSRTPVVY